MDALGATILTALRRMDAEAGPRADGKATGLWWYGGHARPELKRPQSEVEWSRRLGVLLADAGYATRREVPYPDKPRDRCDLVVALRDGRRLWLEVKGAWKDYWLRKGGAGIFRSYLLHPLVPCPSMGKSHTAALDLVKLRRLGPDVADVVAFLLVGFDTADAPLAPEFDELASSAQLGVAPWTGTADSWSDSQGRGVHVCLWWQPTSR
jgi:hypothetical protein